MDVARIKTKMLPYSGRKTGEPRNSSKNPSPRIIPGIAIGSQERKRQHSIEDNGDVPPRWRVGGPKGVLLMPRGVALDPKHKELIVSDKRLNAVLTFSFPEMF